MRPPSRKDQGFDLVATLPPTQLALAADEFRRRSGFWAALAEVAAERTQS